MFTCWICLPVQFVYLLDLFQPPHSLHLLLVLLLDGLVLSPDVLQTLLRLLTLSPLLTEAGTGILVLLLGTEGHSSIHQLTLSFP